MRVEIKLPQFGMGMQDAVLLKWLKNIGEPVVEGDPIAEVEAAKSIVEITAPTSGVISEIMAHESDTILVQAVMAVMNDSPAQAKTEVSAESRRQVEPRARRLALDNGIDIAAVPGTARVTEEDIRQLIKVASQTSANSSASLAPSRETSGTVQTTAIVSIQEQDQNLRLVRDGFYAAIELNDISRAEQVFDPIALEIHEAQSLPYGGIWRGITGFRTLLKLHSETWTTVERKVIQYATGGDLVMVYLWMSGIGKSGMGFSMPIVEIWRCKNQKVVHIQVLYGDSGRIGECGRP